MGKMSRDKGKIGERELAKCFREHGYEDARRTSQFCGQTGDAADVIGLPGIHVECKRVEKLNIHDAFDQAKRDSEAKGIGQIPVVFHRRNNTKWLVTMCIDDWFTLYREWECGRKE